MRQLHPNVRDKVPWERANWLHWVLAPVLAACGIGGPSTGGKTCPCSSSEVCVEQTCQQRCSSDNDCLRSESCMTVGTTKVCIGNTSGPPDPGTSADMGSGPAGVMLHVQLSGPTQAECIGGYVTIVYDKAGKAVSSQPGQPLDLFVPNDWNGWAGVAAMCGRIYRPWDSALNQNARDAGFVSIQLGGVDLTTQSMVCNDPYGFGIKPFVPLNSPNFGKCP